MRILLVLSVLVIMLAACSGKGSTQTSTSDNHNQKSAQGKGNSKQKENHASKGKDKKADSKKQTIKKSKKQQRSHVKKPKYKMNKKTQYIEPIGDDDPKVVLLTIDDAPDQHAVEIAKTLKRMHAKAIFFVMGSLLKSDEGQKRLKKIHDMGFTIGNHTVSHPTLSQLSRTKQRKEVVPVYQRIKKVTGEPAKFFRAPHGVNTDVSNQLAAKRGVLPMNWSYGYDWHRKYQNPKALTDIMLRPDPPALLHNGAILLMHDRPWTAKAMPQIVKGLRDKGYHFVDPAEIKTPKKAS